MSFRKTFTKFYFNQSVRILPESYTRFKIYVRCLVSNILRTSACTLSWLGFFRFFIAFRTCWTLDSRISGARPVFSIDRLSGFSCALKTIQMDPNMPWSHTETQRSALFDTNFGLFWTWWKATVFSKGRCQRTSRSFF